MRYDPISPRDQLGREVELNGRDARLKSNVSYRATLHASSLGYVEDAYVSPSTVPPSGYEPHHQIVVPYHGLFNYNVGGKRWLMDPNRILFISPGWEFFDDHPLPNLGHAAVLINPSTGLLDEICLGSDPASNSAFALVSRPPTPGLRLLTHRLLHSRSMLRDPLCRDEWIVRITHEALDGPRPRGSEPAKVVSRAKEFLHASCSERLSLVEVASQVGVTPVYLTQEFTRTEGMPLYRYQTHLRLNRALLELPYCEDITGLALDLGFSSHSHFTSVFRNTFGITPSEFPSSVGPPVLI